MVELASKYLVEIILTGVSGAVILVFTQYKGLKYGMRALLKNEIMRICSESSRDGFCPAHIKDVAQEMYENYHKLGGNGMVETAIQIIYQMPTEKE